MTNTPNRRRRERATSERADSIVDELRRLPSGLEHRLAVADLGGVYEQLRELLSGGSEEVERFRGLLRQREAPSAATVGAILEASRAPRPVEVGEVHYGPGTHPNPVPLSVVADDPLRRQAAAVQLARLEALFDLYRLEPLHLIDPLRRSTS